MNGMTLRSGLFGQAGSKVCWTRQKEWPSPQEVDNVADHLYHLAMDATYEHALQVVSCTQTRRLLWLKAMGVTDNTSLTRWLNHPVSLSGTGLFEASPEMLGDLRAQQELQRALAVNLSTALPGPSECSTRQTPETTRPKGPGNSRRPKSKPKKASGQAD